MKYPRASGAECGRPRVSKAIDEGQRGRDDHYPSPRQIDLTNATTPLLPPPSEVMAG